MKKFMFLVLAMMLMTGLVAGCGGGGEKKKEAASAKPATTQKEIVVGLDDNFPPMGFKNEKNEIVGFDIDIAKEVAKRLGVPVKFKAIDWGSKEAELKSGRIDCLWNGLDITEDRKKNMLFSEPYMEAKQLIFALKGTKIKGVADLAGKTVGYQAASTAEDNIKADAKLAKSFKGVKTYSDFIAALMDLEAGRLDAVVADEIVGRYYMSKKGDKFVCINTPVGPVGTFGIGFRLDDKQLRDKVQKAFDEIKKDGTAAKISQKWFKADIVLKAKK